MTDLTAEELASVAREVTGEPWAVEEWTPINGEPKKMVVWCPGNYGNTSNITWRPGFRTDGGKLYPAHQRSQALAVVEWLADNTLNAPAKVRPIKESVKLWEKVSMWFALRRINELQHMVLELRTKP